MLFGWMPADRTADTTRVVAGMERALRSHPAQRSAVWTLDGFGIGLFDVAPLGRERTQEMEPATAGGRYSLWMAGEAFDWPSHGGVRSAAASRSIEFRQRVLAALLRRGAEAIRDLDGEYQIAIWDAADRRLTLLNDRFGALALYYATSPDGFAFGGGVRAVVMAPRVSSEPDADAIREAVTFGGFRLGQRTNVRSVRMMRGASSLTCADTLPRESAYWRWRDIPHGPARPVPQIIDDLRRLWTSAIERRLHGAARPALTLSGGLDSRAIMAEAVGRGAAVHAVTYGMPDCDDVRFARQAAERAGAEWSLHPLYSGVAPDWLTRRTAFIQQTDGLIDLVDLMHVEALDVLTAAGDLNLSGYVGDAVTGSTFNHVRSAEDAALALPYYGGRLGLPWDDAVERARSMVDALDGAPPRFALFDHKLPQSTNRITAALRPYIRVRRPFVDYRVFDLAQGQPEAVRGVGLLHERWLLSTYPAIFAVPNQKTGVPPLTPAWRRNLVRAARFAMRRLARASAAAGFPVEEHRRSYHADDVYWRTPDARARIEETILGPRSISCDIFGRAEVTSVVRDWFDRFAAPTQVIGALYVFESYHRDLAGTLREARPSARLEEACSSPQF